MKKALLLCVLYFLLLTGCMNGQNNAVPASNYAFLCKAWGFLKCYHPAIREGKVKDWEACLLQQINYLSQQKNNLSNEHILAMLLKYAGEKHEGYSLAKIPASDTAQFIIDHSWIQNSGITKSQELQLTKWKEHPSKHNYFYTPKKSGLKIATFLIKKAVGLNRGESFHSAIANYFNENTYAETNFPDTSLRLLGLFRYWNTINYFYPHRQCIGNWDSVLLSQIPEFMNCANAQEYRLALEKLIASIHDGHSIIYQLNGKYIPSKYLPVNFSWIDHKVIVSKIFNDSLAKLNNLKTGDEIVEWNNQPINEYLQNKCRYISGANEDYRLNSYISFYLNNTNTEESVVVKIIRSGETITQRLFFYQWKPSYNKARESLAAWKIVDENIGYMDLNRLNGKELSKAFKQLAHTKGIIIDCRGYATTMDKLYQHLSSETKTIAYIYCPDYRIPGLMKREKITLKGGSKNKIYTGKVIVLTDILSISQSETTILALKATGKVYLLGNHTSGTNGDIRGLVFPGAYNTDISSVEVREPNGVKTQGAGIQPNEITLPSKESLLKKENFLIERATSIIKKQTGI